MKLVYLAAPIDFADNRIDVNTDRRRAIELLRSNDFGVFDPMAAFDVVNQAPDARVYEINQDALSRCDGVLALLPIGVPSVGVPMEIKHAAEVMRIPVAVVGGGKSWSLAGLVGVETHSAIRDAVHWLRAALAKERPEYNVRFHRLQKDIAAWALRNFGEQPDVHPLLGVVEEAGELCHVYLKQAQGIRNADLEIKGKDAVGDLAIYLLAFCEEMGWDFETVVAEVWSEVRQRDWKRFPGDGRTH